MKIREITNDFKMYFEDRLIIKTDDSYKEGMVGCKHGLIMNTRNLSPEELSEVLEAEIEFRGEGSPLPGRPVTIIAHGKFPYINEPRYYPAYSYYTGERLGSPNVGRER